VAIIGRPNVGKSTLLNAALEQPLAIVSPTPQTTRDAILGIVRHGGAEIALLDTPGLHKPKSALGRAMNRTAREAARGAEVIVFVTDVPSGNALARLQKARDPGAAPRDQVPVRAHPGDLSLLADVPPDGPGLLVVNKVDLVKDKALLLPLIEALSAVRTFAAIVPISALRPNGGVERVLDEVAKLCPEGPYRHEEDELTDRPVRFFAAEYVREQILRATVEEVPHATAVEVTHFIEPQPGSTAAVRIEATIHVERAGQKKILVGAGAAMVKRIGTAARLRIEEMLGRRVHLALFVRVTPGWRDSPRQLAELGYAASGTREHAGADADADGGRS
jgi:GTP-binding protein Era